MERPLVWLDSGVCKYVTKAEINLRKCKYTRFKLKPYKTNLEYV